jgi:TolB protein
LPAIYPRFTPDGTAVIYHTWSSGPDRVWRVPRAGGPATPLTPVREEDDQYADISPDGRYLAFARTEKETTRICVAPVEGGEARYLTNSPSTLPRWSPDGRWIAFSPSRGYDGGIFVIAVDGTALRRLTSFGGWPVWWPKEQRVAFLAVAADGAQQILSVPFKGGPTETVPSPRFVGTNHPFDISADETLLVTSNPISISGEIWLLEPR